MALSPLANPENCERAKLRHVRTISDVYAFIRQCIVTAARSAIDKHWRDLVKARVEHFARVPAMTVEGAAALQAVDDAKRAYRDLHEQRLQAPRRMWNYTTTER